MVLFNLCFLTIQLHHGSIFASVYLAAIIILKGESYDAAVALDGIVLEDAFNIWRRGTYHRQLIETIPNAEAEYRTNAISEYVLEILRGVERIFDVLPSELSIYFKTLSRKAGYSPE